MTALRKDGLVLGAAAAVCSLSALGAVTFAAACVTTPPPDLPKVSQPPPTILHGSVVPPADLILSTWPAEFDVPLEIYDPSASFAWEAFVDYDPTSNTSPLTGQTVGPPIAVDAGVYVQAFHLGQPSDLGFCHRIEFDVARGFDTTSGSPHTPNSLGGDSIVWFYNAGGGPNGCPVYDAGDVQDGGGFPASDGPVDGLAVVPGPGADP
ncbi:MAG TPA: hypothetical protein VKU41_09645 [Polyangiaceae bacterium]|nr:hypothetical protein [Polyangiaceae bacterium]